MARAGRGRFYEAVGGLGLEIETDNSDPDYQWHVACIIEKEGKRRPVYRIKINRQEESYFAPGYYATIEEAKTEALKTFKVSEVVEEEKPSPFAWMKATK